MLETVLNCLRAADHVVDSLAQTFLLRVASPVVEQREWVYYFKINPSPFEIYIYRSRHTISTNYSILLKEEEIR
jgi:hypothetical protein